MDNLCRKCHKNPFRRHKSGKIISCLDCTREYQADWYRRNQDGVIERTFQRLYGISRADKQRKLDEQGGCCAACGTKDPGRIGKRGGGWHLDHDHETGEIRGVLCGACNQTIGYAREDIVRLKRCAAYIMKHKHLTLHMVLDDIKRRGLFRSAA
jgi:hypothetical protein